MQLSIDKIKSRYKKAQAEMDFNRGMFEDAYDYLMPFRNIYNGTQDSHNRPTKQYDSTAMIAANNFVNTMQKNFTPVFTRWAELKAGAGVPENQREQYNKSLSALTDIIFTYMNASNFSTASSEMYFDLGIGTGIMLILEGDEQRPINHVAVPLAQVAIEDGRFGEVGGLYRKSKVKPNLIKHKWRKAKLNKDLEDLAKEEKQEEVELVEAFYYDYEDLVWYYEVIHFESEHKLLQETSKEAPFVAPRWMKIPGYATGIGVFLQAMADYKTLNKMKELTLQLAALNTFGAYTVAAGGGFNPNTAAVKPASFIPVERNGGPNGPTIAALPRTGDFQVQQFMVEDLKDQIRQVMLDNRLPPESGQARTAFEIAERIKELSTDIGSAYGRIMFEYVIPYFRRVISILDRKGLVELPKGFDIDNFFVQVQVVSPIAQQQAMEDVQRMTQAFQMTSGINPELALMSFEVEKVPSWLVEKMGVDAKLLRSEEGKQQLQQAVANMLAQQQAAQQQAAQPQQQAGVA